MKTADFTTMSDETLQESEDLISNELGEIASIKKPVLNYLPQCVQALISERQEELFKLWTSSMSELEKRNLSPLDTGEA